MESYNKDLKIDLDAIIASKSERLAKFTPKFVVNWVKRIVHQDELNEILKFSNGAIDVEFADKVLLWLNAKSNVKFINRESLRSDGRYIFVSNHPLGGLDGLILISSLGKMFGKVKFVVNDILMHILPMRNIFVPVNKHGSMGKDYGERIHNAYASDAQMLYFPSGLCSRLIDGKITDLEWKRNFIKQAKRYNRDIVPVYFGGRNSNFFYRLAKIRKMLGIKFNFEMIFLPDEMFRQKNSIFDVVIGEPIPISSIDSTRTLDQWCQEIREKCYKLKEK
ncbi:MAG: 1-acyl-sn-glycerol-3-phosphate acyltransferase [Bacteroidales bacterium]|nr:1-acyl-sn-glycerol-3-phosphate acyltransferase [Bacteroidales bacterium]